MAKSASSSGIKVELDTRTISRLQGSHITRSTSTPASSFSSATTATTGSPTGSPSPTTTELRPHSMSPSTCRSISVGSAATASISRLLSSAADCHSRILWVAGLNGGPDFAVHGLRHIFQQIIRPGDFIYALVLFDSIPSDLGINFALDPKGFRGAADRSLLPWLTKKLRDWRDVLKNLTTHCKKEDITLELRLCAGSSLAETAVREAHYLQASDVILDRSKNGQKAVIERVAKLLSEKTEARVALMDNLPQSNKVEPSIQMPRSRSPHNFSSLILVDPRKQALVSKMLPGWDVLYQESVEPYYVSISVILSEAAASSASPVSPVLSP